MLLRIIARPLLSAVFIGQGLDSLRNPHAAADAARPTVEGLAKLPTSVSAQLPTDPSGIERFAMITAVVQIGAGALLASGKLPRVSSAALACTIVPSRIGAHMFWAEEDPERKRRQRRDFLTDVSLLGGLMIAAADTAGKPSLGWRSRRAAERLSAAISAPTPGGVSDSDFAEKLSHGVEAGVERGRELVDVALKRTAPLVDTARERGSELAEIARERGTELAEIARERGMELADVARERGTELAGATRRLARSVG